MERTVVNAINDFIDAKRAGEPVAEDATLVSLAVTVAVVRRTCEDRALRAA